MKLDSVESIVKTNWLYRILFRGIRLKGVEYKFTYGFHIIVIKLLGNHVSSSFHEIVYIILSQKSKKTVNFGQVQGVLLLLQPTINPDKN